MAWTDLFDRKDGSHMTQMDVGIDGRLLTVREIRHIRHEGKRRVEVVWAEDVLPWMIPQQEALLLSALGCEDDALPGALLRIVRDPSVRFGPEVVGGSRIVATSIQPQPVDVRWRCGTRTLSRRIDSIDPLAVLADQWGVTMADLDAWAATSGRPQVSTWAWAQRGALARKLNKNDVKSAILAAKGATP